MVKGIKRENIDASFKILCNALNYKGAIISKPDAIYTTFERKGNQELLYRNVKYLNKNDFKKISSGEGWVFSSWLLKMGEYPVKKKTKTIISSTKLHNYLFGYINKNNKFVTYGLEEFFETVTVPIKYKKYKDKQLKIHRIKQDKEILKKLFFKFEAKNELDFFIKTDYFVNSKFNIDIINVKKYLERSIPNDKLNNFVIPYSFYRLGLTEYEERFVPKHDYSNSSSSILGAFNQTIDYALKLFANPSNNEEKIVFLCHYENLLLFLLKHEYLFETNPDRSKKLSYSIELIWEVIQERIKTAQESMGLRINDNNALDGRVETSS